MLHLHTNGVVTCYDTVVLRVTYAALSIAAVSACGPTVGLGSSGSAETTGSTTATNPDSSESTGTRPPPSCAPQVGTDPLAGDPTCAQLTGLQDGLTLPQVRVRIVNRTDETIAVPNRTFGCQQPARHFDVEGTQGGRTVSAVNEYCALGWNACSIHANNGGSCLLCLTLIPPIVLAPGGWYEETWDAWVISEVTLPEHCSATKMQELCNAPIAAMAGSYELRASAAPTASCNLPCDCEPDSTGSCQPTDWPEIEPTLLATATWDGMCETVELAFDD